MSTVKANTIQNVAGTKPPEVTLGEFVQARFNMDCSTATARDSFGVSSFTDNGTGEFNTNLSTAFGNTGYSAVTSGEGTDLGTSNIGLNAMEQITNATTIQRTASVFPFVTLDSAYNVDDALIMSAILAGDYA